ncbi:MAG: chemotaxis protein [Desulfocurvibacter africanus]
MAQHNILLEAGTNELEIVEFYIDEQTPDGKSYKGYYGVNVAKVLEIIRQPTITEVPQVTHASILGAFNQRSRIIPLVDLAIWLDKTRTEPLEPKVIVTEFNAVTTGFLVSGVTRIHRMSWESVEPPNRYVSSFSSDSITGVVKIDGRIIFILDLEKIVAEINPGMRMRLNADSRKDEGARYRAMVVDDSALIRNMLKSLLEGANFSVETAENGREGWDRLQDYKERADREGRDLPEFVQIVISDIEMPSMDGHSLTKRIKEDPELRRLPVVLFSSLISDKLRHKGEAVGADDQITKPQIDKLATRSKELIAERFGIPA